MLKDLRQLWDSLPHKAEAAVVLAAWTALFHWMGNASLGYIDTASLFVWLQRIFDTADKYDNDDAFGRFVPFLVLALAAVRARELAAAGKRLWAPGLAIVAGALLLHAAGFLVQQPRVSLLAYLVGVYGVTGLFWGPGWLGAFFFPYFLLGFAIPINAYLDPLTSRLRLLAASVSTGICTQLLSMKLDRSGVVVSFPGTAKVPGFQFEVAAACSGIRSLIVVLVLTTAYGWLNFASPWRRAVVLLAAVPLAVLGNIVRLVFTFVVAEAAGQKAASAVETKAGAFTFVVALAGVFAIGRLLRERRDEPEPAADAAPEPGDAPGGSTP